MPTSLCYLVGSMIHSFILRDERKLCHEFCIYNDSYSSVLHCYGDVIAPIDHKFWYPCTRCWFVQLWIITDPTKCCGTQKLNWTYSLQTSTDHILVIWKHRVIHKSPRDFWPLWYSSRDGRTEGEHVNRGTDTPSFCLTLQLLNSSFCCVCLGCCTAEFISPGWTRDLWNYPVHPSITDQKLVIATA
jgi:hypothetical protein